MKKALFIIILIIAGSCDNEDFDPDKYIYPVGLHTSRTPGGIQVRMYSALALYRSNRMWLPGGETADIIELLHSEGDTLSFELVHQYKGEFEDVFTFPVEEAGRHHFFRIKAYSKNIRPFVSKIVQVEYRPNPSFEPLLEFPNNVPIDLGNFSSDGSEITYSIYKEYAMDNQVREGTVVMIADAAGIERKMMIADAYTPVWSPEADLIAFMYHTGEDPNRQYSNLGLYDHSNDSVISLTSGTHHFYLPVWHPDGNSIFFLSENREDNSFFDIYSLNLLNNEYGPIYPGSQLTVSNNRLSFTPDGKVLAFTDYTETYMHNVFFLEVESGEVTPLDQSFGYWEERFPVISPDGRYLAFLSQRSGLHELWIKDLNTRLLHQLTGDETMYIVGNMMWDADSDKIYFQTYNDEKFGVFAIDHVSIYINRAR